MVGPTFHLRDETSIVWVGSDNCEEACVSFSAMWERTTTVMRFPADQGVANQGDRLLFCMSPGPTFFWVMLARLRGGVVAVPVYPPNPSRHMQRRGLDKLQLLRENCQAKAVLYDWPSGRILVNFECTVSSGSFLLLGRAPISADHSIDQEIPASTHLGADVEEDDIAYLQFTSGSTDEPEGVVLSRRNLWHNVNELYRPTLLRCASMDNNRITDVSVESSAALGDDEELSVKIA
ncbi:hypothetical protein CTAYLR_002604 [Chrysophaeum taylorii]|uniref:AMP-dependent synthetase/ligase domain-containing protein n=1 Tax=Chrysophaeum taylorii TaxID=2483200 RepID=A0AAD7UEI7_9STRA|nr:hypothetical protein CTAYLR_002604 [Chrysophaeum taylorii]